MQYPAEPLESETSRTHPDPSDHDARALRHVGRYSTETILTNEYGRQLAPRSMEDAMQRTRAKVPGLAANFRYHDLRHYFASLLIAGGSDIKVVQARVRPSAERTLDTYGHLWPDCDDSTRAVVDSAFAAHADNLRTASAD